MNKLLSVLFIICAGCSSSKKVHEAYFSEGIYNGEIDKSKTDLIVKTLSEFPNQSEMAIGFVHSKDVLFYGLKRMNDTIKITNNSDSVFEIGSITKVFTTHLLFILLEENKITNLDESIASYLDFTIKGDPQITFRHLANHTSGLPSSLSGSIFNTDAANPYKNWNRDKFVDYFENEVSLASDPGEKYQYSNVGMALLAYALSKIESEEYEYLLQDKIFKPLQMQNSTTQRELIKDYLVQGYNWKGKPTANWDLAEIKGAGAVLSSARDLSKYVIWNFDALKHHLSQMKEPSKTINDNMDIALGWHIIKNETKETFQWHNGGTGGYKSSMAINVSNNTGIVILSNIGATDNPKKGLIDRLCFDLMKSLEK